MDFDDYIEINFVSFSRLIVEKNNEGIRENYQNFKTFLNLRQYG